MRGHVERLNTRVPASAYTSEITCVNKVAAASVCAGGGPGHHTYDSSDDDAEILRLEAAIAEKRKMIHLREELARIELEQEAAVGDLLVADSSAVVSVWTDGSGSSATDEIEDVDAGGTEYMVAVLCERAEE